MANGGGDIRESLRLDRPWDEKKVVTHESLLEFALEAGAEVTERVPTDEKEDENDPALD